MIEILKCLGTHLHLGDCLETMRGMADNSVDSIVTDPPYGLTSARPGGRSPATEGAVMKGFMGLAWDGGVPSVEIWREALRVLKPGGHLLAFAGTRTQHRMACNIEDAGFEIRDMIAWVYGSGFPKSLDVSKAIDDRMGAVRERGEPIQKIGTNKTRVEQGYRPAEVAQGFAKGAPATDAARQWQGWGTALKPALEPITVARKPLIGTVASNVLAHGTGGLNIDGCRVETERPRPGRTSAESKSGLTGMGGAVTYGAFEVRGSVSTDDTMLGRWPANLIHDGSEPADLLGDAARFFYAAKASKKDRGATNNHPTVKPTDLMRYLCRLVTPPGGVVLDPFMGSGSTGKAAVLEGFQFIGCELSAEYLAIADERITEAHPMLV